jgi:hypothetical protein
MAYSMKPRLSTSLSPRETWIPSRSVGLALPTSKAPTVYSTRGPEVRRNVGVPDLSVRNLQGGLIPPNLNEDDTATFF